MYIRTTYDIEFEDLLMHLRSKYGSKLFDLDGIGEQTDMCKFSKKFFSVNTTSDASIDANANVDDISVIAYSTELPKPFFRLNSYFMTWKESKRLFGWEIANEIIERQLIGDIYINDFNGIAAGIPYCNNFSTYDIMTKGLPMIKKIKSIPPKYLYSFKSQLEQFTIIAANSTLGATGLADLLLVMSYYAKNIIETLSDAHFSFKSEFDAWNYIHENIVSFIYTINQPMRGNQSCFTNISIYDEYFLKELQNDYLFPDGSYLDIDIVKKLQNVFLTIMNDELNRTPITFPITTACFSVDEENNIKDKEFLSFISKHNQDFGFINIYCGKTSTLSSCCFDGNQLVIYKDNNEFKSCSFKELFEIKNNNKVEVFYDKWNTAKVIRIKKSDKKLFNITTINNQSIIVTEDHLNPTDNGDIKTVNLKIGHNLKSAFFDSENSKVYFLKDCFTYKEIISIEEVQNDDEYVYCFEVDSEFEPYFTLPNGIITHNCRLRSDKVSEYFNSFGAGSTKIGSLGVVTINLPRLAIKNKDDIGAFYEELKYLVGLCAKINHAKRKLVQKRIDNGNHPLYSFGFIDLKTQYSTCGINGFNECISFLEHDILTTRGIEIGLDIIDTINQENEKYSNQFKFPHNCEQIPAESVSVKLASKDKLLGYQDTYDIYSNQFIPLTTNADLLDRIKLQGIFDKHFTGGAIAHFNLDTRIDDVKKIEDLIVTCAKMGVVYFAINFVIAECEDGHMTVTNNDICPICTKNIINKFTRVVGFLTNVKNWHKVRREQDFPNRQFYKDV